MRSMIVCCVLLSGLSGCMSYDEGRVGPLGYSVYQTTYQQIADKQVAANPGTEVPAAGSDGPLLEKVINSYRGRLVMRSRSVSRSRSKSLIQLAD